MKVKALKRFYHDKLGRVSPGDIVELQEAQATMFLEQRAVERYATKVVRELPLPDAGVTTQSSALPAAQALPKMTSTPSKRGRPAKAKQPL
jgi:hypothetical protein